MGAVLQFMARLESVGPCSVCGVMSAMPEDMVRARRDDKGTFYCPNGHAQCFSESEVDRLKKQLADQTARLEAERRERLMAQENCTAALAQRDSAQDKIRRLKKRAANGVCPCCKRTFSALARHMKSKHPDYSGGSNG